MNTVIRITVILGKSLSMIIIPFYLKKLNRAINFLNLKLGYKGLQGIKIFLVKLIPKSGQKNI